MLNYITQWFTQLFLHQHQSDLDQYIAARRPTSVIDVEQYEREYNNICCRGFL